MDIDPNHMDATQFCSAATNDTKETRVVASRVVPNEVANRETSAAEDAGEGHRFATDGRVLEGAVTRHVDVRTHEEVTRPSVGLEGEIDELRGATNQIRLLRRARAQGVIGPRAAEVLALGSRATAAEQ